jgi:hypothetical protein
LESCHVVVAATPEISGEVVADATSGLVPLGALCRAAAGGKPQRPGPLAG